MVPDTIQVQQRLFWNQKILSLGAAIVGPSKPQQNPSPNTSPTQFTRKEHQLTASCSPKCQTGSGCTLCKNPLYQSCKAHYIFLATTNEDAFWTLYSELEKANIVRSERLTALAWTNISDAVESKAGWMPMLQGPVDLLKFRLLLANSARKAAKQGTVDGMRDLLSAADQIMRVKIPIARYLEHWTMAEDVHSGMRLISKLHILRKCKENHYCFSQMMAHMNPGCLKGISLLLRNISRTKPTADLVVLLRTSWFHRFLLSPRGEEGDL